MSARIYGEKSLRLDQDYENSQKINANAWESTRQHIVSMPKNQLCTRFLPHLDAYSVDHVTVLVIQSTASFNSLG